MLRCLGFSIMMFVVHSTFSQYMIYGTVTDTTKNRLPGVNVHVKGTENGTVTDTDGNYKISIQSPGLYSLVASSIGMKSVERIIQVPNDKVVDFVLSESVEQLDEVRVVDLHATRGSDNTPTTFTNLTKEKLNEQNFGQDMPFLLNWTPSVVTTSDAGTGIGYTGIRIRGSDATRVNVTINGIPYNDSESQSTFWVDIPDVASSAQSVQIQRGVGTSTNGPGAFGASVNMETLNNGEAEYHGHRVNYLQATIGTGSFGTRRYTLQGSTGIGSDFYMDGRLSKILSDGYVDRASSDLTSYYVEGGYDIGSTKIQLIAFGGRERTYQAWYGVDSATLASNRTMNYAGALYDSAGNISSYYDNQVDNYQQDHLQLHFYQRVGETWATRISLHSTWGNGYYEEYQQFRTFSSVGLPDFGSIKMSDMILRKWLDNRYYGLTFSVSRGSVRSALVVGGALSNYSPGRHFGEIVWSEVAGSTEPGYQYYTGESEKADGNVYIKWNYKFNKRVNSFVDLQYRGVIYKTSGTQDDQTTYEVSDHFHFFNPKLGVTYDLKDPNQTESSALYVSYALANREPNRSDYLEGTTKPRPERLHNAEVGWRRKSKTWGLDLNYFMMYYTDQLVQTGTLDAAGYPIRENVGKSYRTGVEASAIFRLSERWTWNANLTWSANKNVGLVFLNSHNFPEPRDTRIILSPDWIAGSQLAWVPIKGFQASWLSKYVGKQYLDNSEDERVSMPDYWINDLRFSYEIAPKGFNKISWSLLINNVLDAKYTSNGYSYSGVPYYYPQAGRNFMAMMIIRL